VTDPGPADRPTGAPAPPDPPAATEPAPANRRDVDRAALPTDVGADDIATVAVSRLPAGATGPAVLEAAAANEATQVCDVCLGAAKPAALGARRVAEHAPGLWRAAVEPTGRRLTWPRARPGCGVAGKPRLRR
jgi:hypothetical protein